MRKLLEAEAARSMITSITQIFWLKQGGGGPDGLGKRVGRVGLRHAECRVGWLWPGGVWGGPH